MTWTLSSAVDLCRRIEAVCPAFGCHVALTGGCLYKDGERKDLDLVFYRVRQVPHIDYSGLFVALEGIGIRLVSSTDGWIDRLEHDGNPIDAFFPEEAGDEYRGLDTPDPMLAPLPLLSDVDLTQRIEAEERATTAWGERLEKSRTEEKRRAAPMTWSKSEPGVFDTLEAF